MAKSTEVQSGSNDDWADQITDLLVDTVDKIRDKTVHPVQKAARGAVYGLIIAFLALPVLVLLLVGIVRLLDNVVPGTVWYIYLGLGLIFCTVGLIVWKKKF